MGREGGVIEPLLLLDAMGACPLPPRKVSNLKGLKCHFQQSQVDSCVKKIPKIDRHFFIF